MQKIFRSNAIHIKHKLIDSKYLFVLILLLVFQSACAYAQAGVPPSPTFFITESNVEEQTIQEQAENTQVLESINKEPLPGKTDIVEVISDNPPTESLSPDEDEELPTNIPSTRTPLPPDAWMTLPVIPTVSDTARQIYQRGLEMGNDPNKFSKVGDCQSITTYFLFYFDMPEYYRLGEFESLQETIDHFSGSFKRGSLSVKGGFNAAAVLSPLRSNPDYCESGESPIACEFRLNNPSIVLISLEEWWADDPDKYEIYMRQIIEYSISEGVLPIVGTKADNLEGEHRINQTIAQLAMEYDIPLWNFWLAVQPLPNHGLIQVDKNGEPDMFHITHSENYYYYDDPKGRQSGWSVRNISALQALDAVWYGVTQD
jgi:hypothetical protein